METFPLQSLTLTQTQQKQFALIDTIYCHLPSADFLAGGDSGLTLGLNQPRVTQRVRKVLAEAFHAEAIASIQGAGTGAIRAGLATLPKPGQRLLVHDVPVYPTTQVLVKQMGITLVRADFDCLPTITQAITWHCPDTALMQHTRQQSWDRYVLAEVLVEITKRGMPTLTDDNYTVMKVSGIGYECGATLLTFSCFKLFGPEGIGAVVGKAEIIAKIRTTFYFGGSQIQGAQALEMLHGLVLAPVMYAVQAGVSERLLMMLNSGVLPEVREAIVVNAQSKVLIVEFHQPIATHVLKAAQERGALPYPVGVESEYEVPPLFYRLSGTFRKADPSPGNYAIRINPNRSGEEMVLRILRESVSAITCE